MHPHHQAFLVIGAVEDADAAALRQRDRAAPHEIMIEFMGRRLLERSDLATLRIDAVEHALDGAVLAGRIHALEDQQQRPAILRVKLLLEIVEALAVGVEDLFALGLVETALLTGLVRLEMKLAGSVETERRHKGPQLEARTGSGFLLMRRRTPVRSSDGIWREQFAPDFYSVIPRWSEGPDPNLEIPGSMFHIAPE